MKSDVDRLRREIAAIRVREPFHARRYPAELRRAVVAYAHEQRRRGSRRHRVARELGLTDQTLAVWMRSSSSVLRPVTVVPTSSTVRTSDSQPPVHREPGPVLVLASGHRIEGLAFDQLVVLARALT